MSTPDRTAPLDSTSIARLADDGLRLALVDTADAAVFDPWLEAESRGFHGGEFADAKREAVRTALAYRRTTGVWDAAVPDPEVPVATINSWAGELSIPGGRTLPSWAISGVTVSPTHRRRGIARNLLEAELRTAAEIGTPMAMLTVSEATIYGRFGFAPAATAANWTFETARVRWTGPATSGRVQFLSIADFRGEIEAFYERLRPTRPGEIGTWPGLWNRMSGQHPGADDARRRLRAVRYADVDGVTRGLALYKIVESEADFTKNALELQYLLHETPDAYAALWRFVLEMDLVSEVRASLRAVDEPVRWQFADWRGVRVETYDHLWLRVLDVPAALEARRYSAPGAIGFSVSDGLDFAAGNWLLETDGDGTGRVSPVASFEGSIPVLELSVNELSALYLGGVAATTLADAGRLRESAPGAAAAADVVLRAERAPYLSVWF